MTGKRSSQAKLQPGERLKVGKNLGQFEDLKTAHVVERLSKKGSLGSEAGRQVGVQPLHILLAVAKSVDFILEQRKVIEGFQKGNEMASF